MQKTLKQTPSLLVCPIGRSFFSHLPSTSSGLRAFLSCSPFCPWFYVCPSGSQHMQKPISLLVCPVQLCCFSGRNNFAPVWNATSSSASQPYSVKGHNSHWTPVPGSSAPLLRLQGIPSRVLGKGCLHPSYGCSPHERQGTRNPDPKKEGLEFSWDVLHSWPITQGLYAR